MEQAIKTKFSSCPKCGGDLVREALCWDYFWLNPETGNIEAYTHEYIGGKPRDDDFPIFCSSCGRKLDEKQSNEEGKLIMGDFI